MVKLGLDTDKIYKHTKKRRDQWKKHDAKPHRIAAQARYYQENKEKIQKRQRELRQSPEIKLRHRTWKMKRYYDDPVQRAKVILRSQVYQFCKRRGGNKKGKTFELLGYTGKELCDHMESLFKEGMTWDNQGEWHIDHRIPASYFTLIDQMRECFALDNLKPEWGEWNISKGDRFIG